MILFKWSAFEHGRAEEVEYGQTNGKAISMQPAFGLPLGRSAGSAPHRENVEKAKNGQQAGG